MKNSIFKVAALLAFGLVLTPTFDQFGLVAQLREQATDVKAAESSSLVGKGARAIEGTWNVIVTIRNCETGTAITTFRAMDMFIQGGSVVDTNAAPPATRGPGFGSWEHVVNNSFTATLRFYQYNPDGSFAGVRRVAQEITINEEADAWESIVANIVFDPAGNQVAVGCATATATRAP